MATNLKIVCDNDAIELNPLASAVHKTLKQKYNLSAEVVFVSPEEIQSLNSSTRGIDRVTDVLSYPTLDGIRGKVINPKDYPLELDDDGNLFIGSIAVCEQRAKEQAEEYGHSLTREITYLICHGLLHLLGYDHEIDSDKTQMRALEEEIMTLIKITR
jgi:probable rRNA maturation factor